MSITRRMAAGALAVWMVAGGAAAVAQEKPAEPPLQGPRVTPNRPPEMEDGFGPGRRERGPRDAGMPMAAYMEVIGKMRGEGAGEHRLSAEQEEKIEAVAEEFRAAAREFRRKNQGAGRPGARPGRDGEMRDGMDEPQRRERVEELRRAAPRAADYQTRIWSVLNERQQAFVKGELDRAREEIEKRRGEEYVRREMEKRRGGEPGTEAAPGGGRPPAPGQGEGRERVQRLLEKLRQLPPEERERVLRMLEEEVERAGGGRAGDGRPGEGKQGDGKGRPPSRRRPVAPPAGDERTAPPPMDEVKVPPPERKG